jgi:hypothetical protein
MAIRAAFALAMLSLVPATAGAQGVEIDHKQVGCIVVGKFPKMGACFTPAAQLARGRVYFRPEGTPSWYYVDMKSDQPCFTGILPKPGKKLVGTKVEYYVEAQDKTFNAARTAEFAPIVVASAGECSKDIPVAPFVNNATVAVFPSVPAGFVGSAAAIGTTAIVGVAAAGAAVAGTAVAVAASNDDSTTTTTIVVGGITTTTVAAATTTTTSTTTTTMPSATNRPPDARLTTIPDPPEGVGPLAVTFDMCASTDPDGDPLTFFFEFGDGTQASGACSQTHTYASSFRAASAATRTYTFNGDAVDSFGASRRRSREVISRDPTTTTTLPCSPPTVDIADPDFSCTSASSLDVEAMATNASSVLFEAFFEEFCESGDFALSSSEKGTEGPAGTFSGTLSLGSGDGCYIIRATASNACGATATDDFGIFKSTYGCGFRGVQDGSQAAWSSDLSVAGGRLQVVMNGAGVAFPGRGRTYGMGAVKPGQNRVEVTLVEAGGTPGLWRFAFMEAQAIAPGTLRVVAGEVVEVGPTMVTFRLKGTPGERIAFTFEKK